MGKNDKLSRDQKRKAKLKKRAERSNNHESLAYTGNKYKTDKYATVFVHTETGIYESYVMCDRELTDDLVESAVERLVLRMRAGPLPPLDQTDEVTISEGGEEELIIANIRRRWRIMQESASLPPRDELIGVLRTILNSISIWRSKSLHSQGYLRYIEGFMKKLGFSIQQISSDFEPIPEPEDDPLLQLGRLWVEEGDQAAATEFARQIESLQSSGESERVIEICQQLLGETEDMSVVPRLKEFAIRGHRALKNPLDQ